MFDIVNADAGQMNNLVKFAEIMASSRVSVPKHLAGQTGDCLAICLQAHKWGMDAFAVAQQSFLVNGTLGYSAQLVNAVISSSTAIKGRFHYQYEWKPKAANGLVRCGAIINGESEVCWGEWLDTSAVTVKNSPLWKTNPKQQASYLAMKQWARLYTPDVILGVYSKDELEESSRAPRDITPKEPVVEITATPEPELTFEDAKAAMDECDTEQCLKEKSKGFRDLSVDDMDRAREYYAQRIRDIKAKKMEVSAEGEIQEE